MLSNSNKGNLKPLNKVNKVRDYTMHIAWPCLMIIKRYVFLESSL